MNLLFSSRQKILVYLNSKVTFEYNGIGFDRSCNIDKTFSSASSY